MIRAAIIGATLGITFAIGAAVADLIHTSRLPHPHVFYDPADFLNSLRRPTT